MKTFGRKSQNASAHSVPPTESNSPADPRQKAGLSILLVRVDPRGLMRTHLVALLLRGRTTSTNPQPAFVDALLLHDGAKWDADVWSTA
jgi:hypothetical protein